MRIYELLEDENTAQLVLIRGNTEYARAKNQHRQLEKFYDQVVAVMKQYGTVQVIDSDVTSDQIPDADKYVGHSRGCGYEHALDSDIYFCLDEYERVPDDYSKGITANTPIKDRPPLHPGHYTLNSQMKSQLIKFLEK